MAMLLITFLQDTAAKLTDIDSPFNSKIIKIEQDQQGFIWIATETSLQRFDGHNFQNISLNHIGNDDLVRINDFIITGGNVIYIATTNKGLLRFATQTDSQPVALPIISDQSISALVYENEVLWIATNSHLFKLKSDNLTHFELPQKKMLVNKLITIDNNTLLASSINSLYVFNKSDSSFAAINFNHVNNDNYIWDIKYNVNTGVLVATDDGLFQGDSDLKTWKPINQNQSKFKTTTMASNNSQYWFGSIADGLLEYNHLNPFDKNTKIFNKDNSGLKYNEVNHIYLDRQGNLWIGFFNGKINFLNKMALAFGYNQGLQYSDDCQNVGQFIYHINEDQKQNMWLTSQDGLLKINDQENTCFLIEIPAEYKNKSAIPLFTFNASDGYVWAYFYNIGFTQFSNEKKPKIIDTLSMIRADIAVFGVIKQFEFMWVLATSSGVMTFDTRDSTLSALGSNNNDLKRAIIMDFYEYEDNKFYLATSRGAAVYDSEQGSISLLKVINDQLNTLALNTLSVDSSQRLWIGSNESGLYIFNEKHELVKHFYQSNEFMEHKNITNMVEDNESNYWVTTENGLIRIPNEADDKTFFNANHGLQENVFNIGAAYINENEKIYLGGLNGFNAFHNDEIGSHPTSNIAISEIKRFNEIILPQVDYDGFQINQASNYLDQITLSHNDYVISFNFTDFNFSNPEGSYFAYMLAGFDPDWNFLDKDIRTATYTNLPSGEFKLMVKSINQFGQWSEKYKSLQINVKPPPWLTWWAISIYILSALLLIYVYVHSKIKKNHRLAMILRDEVAEKTKELNVQKQTVETLLVKKNELFSNVSHEFRTPLTLILGPIKSLLNKPLDTSDIKDLNIINRNANRLLSLVEQLLQIARVSDFETVERSPQQTYRQVESLVESFQHLAEKKNISLQLVENVASVINVSEQFIDAVLGNLLSNAIKYTQSNGDVIVSAIQADQLFVLSVKDSGSGLDNQQQQDIFKRFKRLDLHQGIEGIGIGLSVVEELVTVNRGIIKLESKKGLGSNFIIKMPLSDIEVGCEQHELSTLVHQLQSQSSESQLHDLEYDNQTMDDSLNTVLVIEDNFDMREHINEIINPYYNLIAAENGVKGVALAIEQVPDIIISDVMMPEMDGFKVARVIRSDERTSHIPLMLLTALGDKNNRIKGWRENVDAYMTKPFDRDELLVQIDNMLTIRDILRNKAGILVQHGKSKAVSLPKKDQQFIDKLLEIIEVNFHDPVLNRSGIASMMAVSERQLQRKVKALIDQNPIDMLREFRLNTAKEKLKEGYQVSLVADECGFNSLSYFSQCFKAQFGMSPKQYQQKAK